MCVPVPEEQEKVDQLRKLQKMTEKVSGNGLWRPQTTFNRHKKPFLNSGNKGLSVKVLLENSTHSTIFHDPLFIII